MNSAREFMDLYLQEKAQVEATHRRLHRRLYGRFEKRFLAADYLKFYVERREHREQNPETLVILETSGDTAKAITTGRAGGYPKQYRYHLQQSELGWQITEIEWECVLCGGTGTLS